MKRAAPIKCRLPFGWVEGNATINDDGTMTVHPKTVVVEFSPKLTLTYRR